VKPFTRARGKREILDIKHQGLYRQIITQDAGKFHFGDANEIDIAMATLQPGKGRHKGLDTTCFAIDGAIRDQAAWALADTRRLINLCQFIWQGLGNRRHIRAEREIGKTRANTA